MNKDFNHGDRVKGLHSHKGKLGTIVSEYSAHATLRWDGGKRISTVEKYYLEALDAAK